MHFSIVLFSEYSLIVVLRASALHCCPFQYVPYVVCGVFSSGLPYPSLNGSLEWLLGGGLPAGGARGRQGGEGH